MPMLKHREHNVVCRFLLLASLLLGGEQFVARAQQSVLSVTDFGAAGDAVQFYANTKAGSPLVTTTNIFSSADIGKTIEVFKVGVQTVGINSYGVNSTNRLDLIATITNVVNGTNLYLSTPPQTAVQNTFATAGTDNTPAILKAIAAAGTNATINFPDGTFLCMSRLHNGTDGYAMVAICLNRGGLHFTGTGHTTLLSRGAFRPEDFSVYGWGVHPARGFLFQVVAPVTNDYPIILENLTLDGGLQAGNLDVHGIYVNEIDGLGWDVGHCAWLCFDTTAGTKVTATHQIFTNVIVQHWRGEMFKSIDQNQNGNISIHNCTFRDGCATALNIYGSWDVTSNRFENLFQVAEYYQSYYTNVSYFQNNFVTNITGNGWAWNGAQLTAPLFVMQSNVFYFTGYGNNGIQTTPGANIAVLNNEIHCADYMTAFAIGTAGSQGTVLNSNILIAGNAVFAPNKLAALVNFGGPGVLGVNGLTVSNNTVTATEVQNILAQGNGTATGVSFSNNTVNCAIGKFNIGGGQPMVLVGPDNTYTPAQLYGNTGTTNLVSYGSGPLYPTLYVQTAANFVLDDSSPAQIPAGAYLRFDDSVNTQGSYYFVYPSTQPCSPVTVSTGQVVTFYWTGAAWSTNQPAGTTPPDNGGGTGTNTVPATHTPPSGLHIPLQ
jgi:hypothetical protein